jgi:hypothetical protein
MAIAKSAHGSMDGPLRGIGTLLTGVFMVSACTSSADSVRSTEVDEETSALVEAETANPDFDPNAFCVDPQPWADAPSYNEGSNNATRLSLASTELAPDEYPPEWRDQTPALVGCIRNGARELVQECGEYAEEVVPGTYGVGLDVVLYRRSFEVLLYEAQTAALLDQMTLEVDPECPESIEAAEDMETVELANEYEIIESPSEQDVYDRIREYVLPTG